MRDALTIPFTLRGLAGEVRVRMGSNEEPRRWGWHLLGLGDHDLSGFPVCEAKVAYEGEGYAANFGWAQVIEHPLGDPAEDHVALQPVICDAAPMFASTGMPFMSWGPCPTLFDAPAYDEREEWVFRATSFLTYTPDSLMTPVSAPVCGFSWGYEVHGWVPSPSPVTRATDADWERIRGHLREAHPHWTFR